MNALSALIDDRPDDGVFRIHRAIFDDPAVFDLELRHIFESGWVFLSMSAYMFSSFATWVPCRMYCITS